MSEHPTVAETIAELRDLYEHGRSYTVRRVAGQAAEHLARASSLAPVAPSIPFPDPCFVCGNCGPCVVDEDGCCRTCGADAPVQALAPVAPDLARRSGLTIFAGFLTTQLPELHNVEAPRMIEAIDFYLGAARDRVAPPSGAQKDE